MSFPNFFIIGAPRSGTTSLYYYLKEHPDIYMCPEKEPNFFSYDEIKQQKLYYQKKNIGSLLKYQKLFKRVLKERAIGEASVSYLYYPKVSQKIKESSPEAKIIMILRNPIERAFSHYIMDVRLGYTHMLFEDIIFNKKHNRLFYQQYLELGLYYNQVKRYLTTFTSKNVKILIFNEFIKETKKMVGSIYDFLNVDSNYSPELGKKYNQSVIPKKGLIHFFYGFTGLRKFVKIALPVSIINKTFRFSLNYDLPSFKNETREFLKSFYIEDIQKLQNLIDKDLGFWST